jgi:hypothetical protein
MVLRDYYSPTIMDVVGAWKDTKPYGFTPDGSEVSTMDDVKWVNKWQVSVQKLVEYIADTPEVLAQMVNQEYTTVTRAGIYYIVTANSSLRSEVALKDDYIARVFSKYSPDVVPVGALPDNLNSSDYTYWQLDLPKVLESYWGNIDTPMLLRALWRTRHDYFARFSDAGISTVIHANKAYLAVYNGNRDSAMLSNAVSGVRQAAERLRQPMSPAYRREEVERQAQHLASKVEVKQVFHRDFMEDFWSVIKQQKGGLVPTLEAASDEWEAIPLHQAGVATSRTWGIEIETVHAERTSRPAGWDSHSDGSLSSDSISGECSCDCDSCYDDDHCDDRHSDCLLNSSGSCREFVSPILNSFNSHGLRKLCADIGADESNTTPGIHVHVGAKDLTVSDVAHLLLAYGIVNRLITPLYRRKSFGYCAETGGNTVLWWLREARKYHKAHTTDRHSLPVPADIAYAQHDNSRYHDVNTQSLSKHGTIEFRAMGPYYSYDHLVRWAWFCREMVNVSRLHLPQRVWTACNSVADVIQVLRTYGSESPLLGIDEAIDTNDLVLMEA